VKIQTNLSEDQSIHDSILYPSIEKQVFELLAAEFPDVKHNIRNHVLFLFGDVSCWMTISKKRKLVLTLNSGTIALGDSEQTGPVIELEFNKGVKTKLEGFFEKIRKLQELQEWAKKIQDANKGGDRKEIEAFLNRELGTDKVQVSFWNDGLFNGLNVTFHIHPTGKAPGDGVLCWLEHSNDKITPFWDGSTVRRSCFYNPPAILVDALGKPPVSMTVQQMGERVAAFEELQAKINAFSSLKCEALSRFIELKIWANAVVGEFQLLCNKK
jgi:hypothetical protein